MDFILGERVEDVRHSLTRVRGVFRIRKPIDEVTECFKRLLSSLLITLGQVLLGDRRQESKIFVEVDDAFQVQRIVQCRACRVQLDETLKGRDGLGFFVVLVVGIGLVQLRLLGQRRTRGATFQFLQQRNGLGIGPRIHFVLGLGVDLVGTPTCGVVNGRRRAPVQQCSQTEKHPGRYTR